jgi:asparagine synthase (glutamine-hydrolysing)
MCGLTGLVTLVENRSTEMLDTRITAMADTLHHRGPDDSGTWVDVEHGVALGFRRLAIVDTSPLGHQPMISASGRYVIVFNGEIYNHQRLRNDLKSSFRGGSDTETILAAIEAWGVPRTLERMRGMYGIALWDRERQLLTLVRDRMGEKPLYFGWSGDTFLFGSELRALRAWPEFEQRLDVQALDAFLRRGVVPSPLSVFEGISKLRPGCYAELDFSAHRRPEPQVRSYWSVSDVVHAGARNPFPGTPEEAVDHFDGLMQEVIRDQMMADVPLGAFLSGGVDSSLVVALMQEQSSTPVQTCSIGFDVPEYNEAPYAKAVAEHIGTDHEELYVSSQEAMDVAPQIGHLWDEPFADSSQIPTYLVSKIARRRVTVSLTGDGSDEVFAGYANYRRNMAIWPKIGMLPHPVRTAISNAVLAAPTRPIDAALQVMAPVLPKGEHRKMDSSIFRQYVLRMKESPDRESFFQYGISKWVAEEPLLLEEPSNGNPFIRNLPEDEQLDYLQLMCLRDMEFQLPDDMLVKVDRAAMANSLETRAPFLDHRVVEFAASLPSSYKVRDGAGKWVVKQALLRYVPRELIDRPKRGFAVPIAAWLRGPLRDWAEDLLANSRMEQNGIVRMEVARKMWNGLLEDSRDVQSQRVWYVLQLEQWLRANQI